ncbi:hypothetical protein [Paenibacillus xylanilyticus]|uniref:Uncharacterized protein n=1 Tax=Paenibacillus xylanilyticus TaxID=248903 RepID=A0A7Y6EUQ5_9BACL|nr:hypothetical protein [Paenibacillus xylanilyticus]NUU77362.1 hypothetical protein [Paenibacillus xylanilyticus]
MELQILYNEYMNIKFKLGLPPVRTETFEYGLYEDNSAALFLAGHPEETFTSWLYDLQPRDPHYVPEPDWEPVLADVFHQMDVYDELTLYYLLFTMNTTLSINSYNAYSAMNDFMKSYSYFQLSQLNGVSSLNEGEKRQLRDFFFFSYLYAHPVNEKTLHACSFSGQDLVHTKTNIQLEPYFSAFHDHYSENYDKYSGQIVIAPHEIQACKRLTVELLRSIEGKTAKLSMPSEERLEAVVQLINDVDQMIRMYTENNTALFDIMRDFLAEDHSTAYRDHCFTMLLQNYGLYILYFRFEEIHALVNYFKSTPQWCGIIINKIFTDTIFIQRMMRQKQIEITAYPDVISFFDEEAKKIYI